MPYLIICLRLTYWTEQSRYNFMVDASQFSYWLRHSNFYSTRKFIALLSRNSHSQELIFWYHTVNAVFHRRAVSKKTAAHSQCTRPAHYGKSSLVTVSIQFLVLLHLPSLLYSVRQLLSHFLFCSHNLTRLSLPSSMFSQFSSHFLTRKKIIILGKRRTSGRWEWFIFVRFVWRSFVSRSVFSLAYFFYWTV